MFDQSMREVISRNLPIYMLDQTPSRPDPGCYVSWVYGVLKRFGQKPPAMDRSLKRRLRSFVRLWCRKNLTALDANTDLSVETWLQNTDYDAARKQQLLGNWRNGQSAHLTRKQQMVLSFIKDETYLPPKAVRLINSRDDFFKTLSGPLFSAISKNVFTITEKNSWFIKNVPVCDRPAVILDELKADGKKYYSTDYTAYECHFTSEMMKTIEFGLYDFMVKNLSSEERRKMQVIKGVLAGQNTCKFKHGTVKVTGTRMSGEMNTSLGNGFANLMLTLFAAHISGSGEVKGFVEGDDGLFTFQYEHNAPTIQTYQKLGFTIKMESTFEINEASFCGNVFDTTDKVVLTDPMAVLAGFGWTNKKYVQANRNTRLQLLRSKALSLVHQYNGVPMLSTFGRRVEFLTRGQTVSKRIIANQDMYHRNRLREQCSSPLPVERIPSSSTRLLVEKLYGVTVAQQLTFEREIMKIELDCSFQLNGYPIVPTCDWYYENYALPLKDAKILSQKLNKPFDSTWKYIRTVYTRL